MKYAGVSDVDLYHGNMRFDVNTSVSLTDEPGVRSEVKNLNSFRSVEAAVEYEINRQIELLEKGEPVVQETRGWDEAKQKTTSQRSKEEAEDYRYFPEPDVPPIELTDEYINKITNELPLLPPSIRMQLSSLAIDPKVIEDLLERPKAVGKIIDVLEKSDANAAKRIAFWLIRSGEEVEPPETDQLIGLWRMVEDGKLSPPGARQVYDEMIKTGRGPEEVAEKLNLLQVSDEGEIEEIVKKVLAANPKAAEDVKSGEMRAIGFLVGQVMKESQGKANPSLAQQIIKKQLGIDG
jgi:aspartyl-tRNA(Asn)/glutamyl-tRNA(Gln) amidotransferase subunit B